MKRSIILLLLMFSIAQNTFAKESLRDLFKNNQAIIYTINIRNFGAVDKNADGIIEEERGDIRGTFLNAKEKLNELKEDGINTVHILPITPVGKLKALGTAGSLYAMDGFNKINPQLEDLSNNLSAFEEAKEFINYAHKLNLNVILDLPSCGSYDLSVNKPDWFLFDEEGKSLTPADWTDVRLFKVLNEDNTLFIETLNNFKSFIDMVKELGFDGIRADVAAIKPYEFWREIIDYARKDNSDFLFLAEASPDWSNPAKNGVKNYSSIETLLKAGFDAYYGSFSDFKNLTSANEFNKKMDKNLKILSTNKDKSIIGAFATHDQQSPLLKSKNHWQTVLWLNVTLPLNSYFLDGFSYGDDYLYGYENLKSDFSLTDDEYYFVHSGMFDIFNLTAPIQKKHPELKEEYLKAIKFKNDNINFFKNADYKSLKTGDDKVYAFSRTYLNKELLTVFSLDNKNQNTVIIKNNKFKKPYNFKSINNHNNYEIIKNELKVQLEPNEIQVYSIERK